MSWSRTGLPWCLRREANPKTDSGKRERLGRARMNADVVVLSACETGSGRLQGQEGVMNLARAFLTAGARSVVASLWDVDDRSTATVMESFYEHLKAGSTVKGHFVKRRLDFIKNYGDKAKPNLWAGFEVIGDGTKRFTIEKTNAPLSALKYSTRRPPRSRRSISIRASEERIGRDWPAESRDRIVSLGRS